MIKDNFYPDVTTHLTTGEKFTAYVPSIPITTTTAPNAYWLGWIGYENLPFAYHVSKATVTDTGYKFEDITQRDNFDCGYAFRFPPTQTYQTPSIVQMSRFQENVSKWQSNAGNANENNICFGNRVNVMGAANCNVVLKGLYAVYDSGGNMLTWAFGNMSFTYADFIAFLNGEYSKTLNFGGNYGLVTINRTDFETGYYYKETSTGYFGAEYLIGYSFQPSRIATDNISIGTPSYTPSFMAHINTDEYGDSIITGNVYDFEGNVAYWDKRNPSTITNLVVLGAINSEITFTEIQPLSPFNGGFINKGNLLLYSEFDNFITARAVIPISEVEKHYNLSVRMSNVRDTPNDIPTPYYGYIENDVYAPYITEDNEFTATRITGDLEDPEFLDKLRPWQYDVTKWEDNDYKEEDRPPYTPGGDDNENIGDKITRPATLGIGGTNGFVTLYALRKSDIAQLGALLWTSFIDADYWKNYLFSLALDTGTFSLAGLLNFFVSCRVYPFSLINIAGCASFGRNMYVGTGTVPLAFNSGTTLHVLSNMVDYISGGYCNIPRHFNDWRDYVNTEIMLYIPYCGTVRLNPGDVIGNKISVQYAVDFATGGCIAYVDMETGDGAGYPVGALPGQIGADIPLTATAAGEVAARFIGDALNIGGIVAGEGANVASGALGAAMGKPSAGGSGNVLSGAAGMIGGLPAAMAVDMAVPLAKQGISMLARGAVQAPMLSGGRGFASFGAPQVPYVQIRRGIYPEISGLLSIAGKPAATTTTIGALSGFVQGDVKTDGLPCHENEKSKIRRLIADGIYV